MKKYTALLLAFVCSLFPLAGADEHLRTFAPEEFFPSHLQGIASDGSGIYWSFSDAILKSSWQGGKILRVPAPMHSGDCTVREGKLYVAASLRLPEDVKANQNCTGAVMIYDCKTLKLLKTAALKETPKPDGIVWYNGSLYVANDDFGHQPHPECSVCIYDRDLKFRKKVSFKTGSMMHYGIQTLNLHEGKILAGFYSKPDAFLLEPETFRVQKTFPHSVNVGFAPVPESVAGKPGVFCVGRLAGKKGKWYARAGFFRSENGRIVPFPADQLKKEDKTAEPQRVPKKPDQLPRIPLPVQNEKYPEDARRVPHQEFGPKIIPTAAEQEAGMVLFSRPLTEPVWAETSPRPFERVTQLSGWGAQKQFVTLNFSVLPLRTLKDLKVRFSGNGSPEIRIVRYWDIIYPNYNSFTTDPKNKRFQRMPEFLAPFTSGDFPALEPQRFLLTFCLPAGGTQEIRGDVLVFHDSFDKALKLPLRIKVLPFELKQDPHKHYSAAYYPLRSRRSAFYMANKENEKLIHDTQVAEYRRMREYGFTRPPSAQLTYGSLPDGTKDAYYIANMDKMMAELKEAGFPVSEPIAVGGCGNTWLYEKFTGKSFGSFHMENIDLAAIPEEMYKTMGAALDRYLVYARKNHYPELIYAPIDEPSMQSVPHVIRVAKIFKERGLTTYQTSPPEELVRKADPYFDIWKYGAFHVPYEQATAGKKRYWCYPNDNSYQIKDPAVMCHGGRMTYGLGYWRSGFEGLAPWIWGNNNPNRVCNSGGVLRLADGSILMTVYWECFRLGIDDERYIYTLEDAVVRRENSKDPKVIATAGHARTVLQETWNAVCPQPAYLRDNLLHHAELDARRAEIANAILELKKFPETGSRTAPSVIIDPEGRYRAEKSVENASMIFRRLDKWQPIAKELTLKEIPGGQLVTVKIDHRLRGESPKGNPIGWPRIRYVFRGKEGADFTKYTHLEFELTVSSDRDIQNDYRWPLSFTGRSRSGEGCEFRFCSTLEPGIRHKIRIPVDSMRPLSRDGLRKMDSIQLVVSEVNFPHGTTLSLKFENIRLAGFSAPTITAVGAPKLAALPVSNFSVPVSVGGVPEKETVDVTAELIDVKGNTVKKSVAPVCGGTAQCGFTGTALKPGTYTVRCSLNKGGQHVLRQLRIIAGPAAVTPERSGR